MNASDTQAKSTQARSTPRLIIVSNRLPFIVEKDGDFLTLRPGAGGLATSLAPVLSNRGGLWIGWSGIADANEQEMTDLLNKRQRDFGFSFLVLPAPLRRLPSIEINFSFSSFGSA